MKEITADESISSVLRLFAEISENKKVAISVYPEFLRDVANEVEQLEKKVSKYEHSPIQHRWLRGLRRNPMGVLAHKTEMKYQDIVQRLRTAYDDMRTGSRNDLKEAADEIERLRTEYSLWKMTAEHLARQLGKMEYADTTYQDIVDSIERVSEAMRNE